MFWICTRLLIHVVSWYFYLEKIDVDAWIFMIWLSLGQLRNLYSVESIMVHYCLVIQVFCAISIPLSSQEFHTDFQSYGSLLFTWLIQLGKWGLYVE